ncbi:MAG: FtsW/RodA/SpoVE family cell cycle protein [Eubacteriales bacterium]|nr:FtsW/RodA/SpoVE family cell cycle protein [Eubacteriales bacterium]
MSRYMIPLFLYLFLGCGLYALAVRSVQRQRAAANLQCVFLFLMQFCAYLTIIIRTRRMEYLLFYAFLQILTLALPLMAYFLYPGLSRILLNHMCMLLSAGLILLTRMDLSKAVRQLAIAAASFVLLLFVPWLMKGCAAWRASRREGSIWAQERVGWLYGAVGIAALGTVLVLGQVTHGSKLSWSLFGLTFQPSEFVKLTYVLFIASLLSKSTSFRRVAAAGLGAAAHVLILALSRDLGSALIYFAVYVLMITVASRRLWYLLGGVAAGAGASVLALRLFSHVQVRVQAWRDPWSVIDSQGYQITQSLFAISRGGLFGLGIGKGTPGDIPYVETDFIFAALVEELGLLFGIGILLVCAVLFLLLMQLAGSLADGYYRNIAAGFGMLYAFQTFLTVGGGIKLIPLTGVTLPLVSYGGSSVTATILMIGIVEGVQVMRYDEEIRLEKQRRKKEKRGEA